jgi:hypothetical protein
MSEFVKIEHEGETTEVEIKPCRHCGKLPTAEDAQKAVAHDRDRVKACAVCGGKPKMYPKHNLYHSVDCDGSGGFILCGTGEPLDPTWHPDWAHVSSYGPSGRVEGAFHVTCLKKVAPGITIDPR